MSENENKPKSKVNVVPVGNDTAVMMAPLSKELERLIKSEQESFIKLSLDTDPSKESASYKALYKVKLGNVPNSIIKMIRSNEELIGGVIIPTRQMQLSLFARPRANRFDVGFELNFKPHVYSEYSEEQINSMKKDIIPKLREILLNCGSNEGVDDKEKRTLSQFIMEITEDFMSSGWFASEVRKNKNGEFHSFRGVDALTVYFAQPQKPSSREADNLRRQTEDLLNRLNGTNIKTSRFMNDEYSWVQVIEGIPRQVFTDDELIVWQMRPTLDIDKRGYPISPVERILQSITTHINLTTQNKMFFLNGKAAKNIMVFQGEDLEETDISMIRNQMSAHINSSNAAHRMPVFGIGKDDSINVIPLDGGGRDMEFQYLADLNKRMIFAAYQMSPDEVAALSYLSKGTNSQAMSESNNEYKLISAKDTGLRPILLSLEDFFNERLLPKINQEWSKLIRINFAGLDSDSPEKEATRLQQDSNLYLSMDDIMDKVEKDKVAIGGKFPLNQAYLGILMKFYTKGQILKAFGGEEFKDADKDPNLNYYMDDQAWFSVQQMKQQEMQMQAQAAQQGQQPQQSGQQVDPNQPAPQGQDLSSAIDQLHELLGKSENLPAVRKDLLKKHTEAKNKILNDFESESKESMDRIIAALTGNSPHGHD